MRIIIDGNLSSLLRTFLWALGLVIVASSYHLLSGMPLFVGVVIGMVVLAIGTYSERANLLNIKPFDNSYKKARDSYKTSAEKPDEQE